MRCVFLCADELDARLQSFRERHDPLGNLIEPHITLVFPFDSNIEDDALAEHIESSTSLVASFAASLAPKAILQEGYVYFPLEDGMLQAAALHQQLYSGLLASFLLDVPYVPHITVGRADAAQAQQILHRANALEFTREFRISRLKLERICTNGESEIIRQFDLGT